MTLLAVPGCGGVTPSAREDAASAAAERFSGEVRGGDLEAGCAMLAPQTVEELEGSAGKPCAEALAEEDLPAVGTVRAVEVYGGQAEVRGSGDTLFLTDLGGPWQVVAAGCRPRRDRPYDCAVKGG